MKVLDTEDANLGEKLELAINGTEYMEPKVEEKTLKMQPKRRGQILP